MKLLTLALLTLAAASALGAADCYTEVTSVTVIDYSEVCTPVGCFSVPTGWHTEWVSTQVCPPIVEG